MSHASRSRRPEGGKAQTMSDTFGPTSQPPLARYDRDSSSWRTCADTSLWDLPMSLETLPPCGMTCDGYLYELPTPEELTRAPEFSSLPSPGANDSTGAETQEARAARRAGGPALRDLPNLLPTTTTQDAANNGGPSSQFDRNTVPLNALVTTLLPTPTVVDMGDNKTPTEWTEWTERMRQRHGNGNGHGRSLTQETLAMLPTPKAGDGERGRDRPRRRPDTRGRELATAVGSIGASTDPRSDDGPECSGDRHPARLF